MANPLSMDLRDRAMARIEAGETMKSVAAALGVARSSVSKWAARKAKTGSVAPGKMGGHNPGVLVGEPAAWLRERIAGADFTLRGLQAELAERDVRAAYKAVWRFVHAEKLTYKKKAFCRPSKTVLMWPANARAGKPGKGPSTSSDLFSSMRHGPRPTWVRCAAGLCAATG